MPWHGLIIVVIPYEIWVWCEMQDHVPRIELRRLHLLTILLLGHGLRLPSMLGGALLSWCCCLLNSVMLAVILVAWCWVLGVGYVAGWWGCFRFIFYLSRYLGRWQVTQAREGLAAIIIEVCEICDYNCFHLASLLSLLLQMSTTDSILISISQIITADIL